MKPPSLLLPADDDPGHYVLFVPGWPEGAECIDYKLLDDGVALQYRLDGDEHVMGAQIEKPPPELKKLTVVPMEEAAS